MIHLLKLIYDRIVIITSKLFESGDLTSLAGYPNSKLANVYFGIELAKRTKNSGVNVYMVCPGFAYTGLFRNVKRSWYFYIFFLPIALLILRSANQVINIFIPYTYFCNEYFHYIYYLYLYFSHRLHKLYYIVQLSLPYLMKVVIFTVIVNPMYQKRN